MPLGHPPLKRKLFITAPLIAVLFSIITAVVSLKLNLLKDAETLREEFYRQNSTLMARGDVAGLRRNLEAMAVTYHLVCVEGQTKHIVFFKRAKSSCREGLISKTILITSAKNPGLKISATMMIRRSHLVLAAGLIAVQIVLLILLSHVSRLLQAEVLEHEIDKSRAFAALTTMLAHDVRRPLAVTKMAVDMLKTVTSMPALKRMIKKIVPEIDRASAGVEGLILDVMELGRGSEQNFYRSRVDVKHLLKDSLDHVLTYKSKSNLSIEIKQNQSLSVHGNEFRLKRVISNLIENALDAAAPAGLVMIEASEENSLVSIRISNTHSYIPRAEREKVFELFYTKGKAEGTGLGLAIAKKIIAAHQGKVRCRSRRGEAYPDGWTEFEVTLPVYDDFIAGEALSPSALDQKSGLIAMIDDSVITTEAWSRSLREDVTVEVYSSPEEFFQVINTMPEKLSSFDLVLTDYYFEDSRYNGEHVASFVYDKGYDVPVVLTSCMISDHKVAQTFDAVIDKQPTNFVSLMRAVGEGSVFKQ
jgi:signal transduction histidine kinase